MEVNLRSAEIIVEAREHFEKSGVALYKLFWDDTQMPPSATGPRTVSHTQIAEAEKVFKRALQWTRDYKNPALLFRRGKVTLNIILRALFTMRQPDSRPAPLAIRLMIVRQLVEDKVRYHKHGLIMKRRVVYPVWMLAWSGILCAKFVRIRGRRGWR